MNFPENLKYTETHEWIKVEGDEAYVGITEFAVTHLGDIVFVEIETVGETLDRKETFGNIEAVKTVSDVFMPVAGEVLEANQAALDDPALINKDPYNKAWLIKIKITNPDELNSLLDAKAYAEIAKD